MLNSFPSNMLICNLDLQPGGVAFDMLLYRQNNREFGAVGSDWISGKGNLLF